MNESSVTSRIAGWDPIERLLAAWAVAAMLLIFGGQFQSLILIGLGSAVLFGSIAWLKTSVQSPVFRRLVPVMGGIYLFIGGIFFRNDLLEWAGLLLAWGWLIWLNRSELMTFVRRETETDE